jgi:hypothetical protein
MASQFDALDAVWIKRSREKRRESFVPSAYGAGWIIDLLGSYGSVGIEQTCGVWGGVVEIFATGNARRLPASWGVTKRRRAAALHIQRCTVGNSEE